jgi:hypothetical protein
MLGTQYFSSLLQNVNGSNIILLSSGTLGELNFCSFFEYLLKYLLMHLTSAFIHFTFLPNRTMLRVGRRAYSTTPSVASTPSGDAWHHDLLAYLGSINTGFVALAALRLYSLLSVPGSPAEASEDTNLDVLALTVLAVANASQAVLNLAVMRKNERWIVGKGFDRITVLDTVFAVLDTAVVVTKLVK